MIRVPMPSGVKKSLRSSGRPTSSEPPQNASTCRKISATGLSGEGTNSGVGQKSWASYIVRPMSEFVSPRPT